MKKVIIALLMACMPMAYSEIVIADGEKSAYAIVIPDPTNDKALDRFIVLSGELLQSTIHNACGANLKIVKEAEHNPESPAIYVGPTEAVKKAGFDKPAFEDWEYSIHASGKNIYIYGCDKGNPAKGDQYPGWYIYFTLGTLKSAIVFAEKFVNTRILYGHFNSYGLHDGIKTLPLEKITVPDGYSFRKKPAIKYVSARGAGIVFDVALNIMNCGKKFPGSHTYQNAIPQNEYFKAHPEYFALVKGKRYQHDERPQYCISNPEVQELLYKYLAGAAARGKSIIKLGHSDGFIPCECENCKKMYNTADYSEKLWHLHSDMAARIYKAYPEVKIVIMCYGVTIKPPLLTKKLPPNVMIELAPYSDELIKKWENYNHCGLWTYIYTWGSYLGCGYSPPRSINFLQNQVKDLIKRNFIGAHLDGGAPMNGLQGAFYYIQFKLLENPEDDPYRLLRDYCCFGYGEKAAPLMEKFFLKLNERLEKSPLPENSDWNNFSVLNQFKAVKVWRERYPENIVTELEKLLSEAEKAAQPGNYLMKMARLEFDYLKYSANAVNALTRFEKSSKEKDLQDLVKAISERNDFINSIPRDKNSKVPRADRDIFNGALIESIHQGGCMQGMFGEPITMDTSKLLKKRLNLNITEVSGFNDVKWDKKEWQSLSPLDAAAKLKYPTRFKAAYDKNAILLKFEAELDPAKEYKPMGRDGKAWSTDCIEIFIAPEKDSFSQFVFNPVADSSWDGKHTMKDGNFKLDEKWDASWNYTVRRDASKWYSEVSIPFSVFGIAARPATLWKIQVASGRLDDKNKRELSAWNIPFNGKFNDFSRFGDLRFE